MLEWVLEMIFCSSQQCLTSGGQIFKYYLKFISINCWYSVAGYQPLRGTHTISPIIVPKVRCITLVTDSVTSYLRYCMKNVGN